MHERGEDISKWVWVLRIFGLLSSKARMHGREGSNKNKRILAYHQNQSLHGYVIVWKVLLLYCFCRALFGCSSCSKRCAQHFLWNFVGIFHVWIEFMIKCQKKTCWLVASLIPKWATLWFPFKSVMGTNWAIFNEIIKLLLNLCFGWMEWLNISLKKRIHVTNLPYCGWICVFSIAFTY